MVNYHQFPPFLLIRALRLLLTGRIHFPKDRIGEVVSEQEDFVIFRQVVVDPAENQPETPGAVFKVSFHFTSFKPGTNKIFSFVPILFIAAQPGFRSKTWMLGKKTGIFQGVYEFDIVKDAENYWDSFPMRLMKRRAVEESLIHSITKL